MDIGILYRPEAIGTVKFDQGALTLISPLLQFENFQFTEPALVQVGVGYIFELGSFAALQLLADGGSYSESGTDMDGNSGSNSAPQGGLARLVISPLIDVSYGTQTTKLSGISIERTTTSIQIPFFEGNNLKLGVQQLKIENGSQELLNVSIPLISFNIQWGDHQQKREGVGGSS